MTLRTLGLRRNPFARMAGPILAIVAAIAASGVVAEPARADGVFARAFEAELGRIAARELTQVGRHVLRLGHMDVRWYSIPPGFRSDSRYERRLREHRHHRHHGVRCYRDHREARSEHRDRHERHGRRR